MPPVAPAAAFLMFWLTTVITPLPSVETDATYCDVAVEDSQPHSLAIGSEVEDWITSVMVVRQAEAAKITSEFLARIV